jgi:hypothetical protein
MKKLFAAIAALSAVATIIVVADTQQEANTGPLMSTVPYAIYATQAGGGVTNAGAFHFAQYPTAFFNIPKDVMTMGIVSNSLVGGTFYGFTYDTNYSGLYGTPSLGSSNAPFVAQLASVRITSNSLAAPAPPANGGTLWSSNTTLYWVTKTATNVIAGP